MPHFKHRVTGVTREWRTDNEDIFRRLHNKGWRRVEEAPAPEPLPDSVSDFLDGTKFDTPEKVRNATDEELLDVDGIGPATLRKIREALA